MMALLFLMLLLPWGSMAWADFPLHNMSAECDSDANQVSFRPLISYDQGDPDGATAECLLQNSKLVRIKMMIFPLQPYGTNDGPVGWVSLWANKAKVLNKVEFDCPAGTDSCDLMIKVNGKGLSVCRAAYSNSQEPPFKKFIKWNCSFTPNKRLSKVRDSVEFPSPKQRKPPEVGTVARLYEQDKKFCDLFGRQANPRVSPDGFPANVTPPDGYEIPSDPGNVGGYTPIGFDVNNDGLEDNVVVLHARSHPEDSDTFYVYGSKSIPEEPQDLTTESREMFYRLSASRIFPDSWGSWTKPATAPWWNPSDTPEFRPQYLYLWPFRWQGVTYFMTGSAEPAKAHWHLILRPEPNYSATMMCVLHVVQERY